MPNRKPKRVSTFRQDKEKLKEILERAKNPREGNTGVELTDQLSDAGSESAGVSEFRSPSSAKVVLSAQETYRRLSALLAATKEVDFMIESGAIYAALAALPRVKIALEGGGSVKCLRMSDVLNVLGRLAYSPDVGNSVPVGRSFASPASDVQAPEEPIWD